MTAQELRIGNYYDQFGNIHQATWVTIKELSQAPEGQLWCKPIPLTEDWLKRFGFEKQEIQTKSDGTTEIGFVKDIMMVLKGNNFYYAAPYGYPNARITQVHQLQNLYFALTQTELTPSDGGKIE